jgi:hypothetical protein
MNANAHTLKKFMSFVPRCREQELVIGGEAADQAVRWSIEADRTRLNRFLPEHRPDRRGNALLRCGEFCRAS